MANGQAIIDHFEFLVDDDNIGSERELVLANMAYGRIAMMRSWNFLRKEDETHTIGASTLSYALPSDFLYLTDEDSLKIIDSSNNVTQLKIIPFRERKEYQDQSGVVYIDVANSTINFTATSLAEYSGMTLNITYQYLPTDLTVSTSPVFATPFHLVLSYNMAKHFWYNDQVEKDRAWNKEMEFEYQTFLREMNQWDDNLEHAIAPTWRPKPWMDLEDGAGGFSDNNGFYI